MNSSKTKGKALITGASTGIGAVYADRLAGRGYDLILVARDKSRLQDLSRRRIAGTGRDVEVRPADLTNKSDLLRIEEAGPGAPGGEEVIRSSTTDAQQSFFARPETEVI